MVKLATVPRVERTINHASMGHSIEAFRFFEVFGTRWVANILAMSPGSTVEIGPHAVGGTYASSKNRAATEALTPPALMPGALVNDTTGTLVNDAILQNAVDIMVARSPTAKIATMSWCIGYADQRTMDGVDGITPAAAIANFKAAMVFAFNASRVAATQGVGDPTTVKTFLMVPGRHTSGGSPNPFDAERHRKACLELIRDGVNIIRGAELYDLELKDSVHPSKGPLGQIELARRDAEIFGKYALGVTSYTDVNGSAVTIKLGPDIAAFNRVDDTHTMVVFTPEAGDVIVFPAPPAIPFGFRFGEASVDYSQVFSAVSNPVPVYEATAVAQTGTNQLTFTHPPITAVKAFFPYDNVPGFDYSKRIYGGVSLKPLRSWLS